jgi:glycosyltransferase involved in cell wall biosynthesis
MRIALHEPGGAPGDPYPFGDSRLTELVAAALTLAGLQVDHVSPEEVPYPIGAGERGVAGRNLDQFVAAQTSPDRSRPDLWISSRVNEVGGVAVGRAVCAALGIPHVLLQPAVDPLRGVAAGRNSVLHREIVEGSAIIVLSSGCESAIRSSFPSHADRVVLLPPFVDLDAVLPAASGRPIVRTRLAQQHQMRTEDPWLIAPGPMEGGGLDSFRVLAQAMIGLAPLNWWLIVAGRGAQRAEVEALFWRIPVRRHRFVPVETPADLLALLAAADLFVWPSVDETLSLPALEAQALGLPVVAGRSAAMQDVVADGRTGMLTKPGNAASFGNAVSFLLRQPDFRRTYASQGPEWVSRNFDMRIVAAELEAALRRIVARDGDAEAFRPTP